MDGQATPAQIGGSAGRAAREGRDASTSSSARRAAMRARALPLTCPRASAASTPAAPAATARARSTSRRSRRSLIAACGGVVAKHGNRALSSKCGSADVLEALGVTIDAEPAVVERCMRVASIGFAFAPRFHAATRHVGGPAQGARHAHDLQPARAADEPGGRRAPGRRRLRSRVVRADRRGARRARRCGARPSCTARAGSTRSRCAARPTSRSGTTASCARARSRRGVRRRDPEPPGRPGN